MTPPIPRKIDMAHLHSLHISHTVSCRVYKLCYTVGVPGLYRTQYLRVESCQEMGIPGLASSKLFTNNKGLLNLNLHNRMFLRNCGWRRMCEPAGYTASFRSLTGEHFSATLPELDSSSTQNFSSQRAESSVD